MNKLKQYYEYLKKAGADVPDTFESFQSTLQDSNMAKKYYQYLRQNNFDAPDTYESFAYTLGLNGNVKKKENMGGGLELSGATSAASSAISTLASKSKSASGTPLLSEEMEKLGVTLPPQDENIIPVKERPKQEITLKDQRRNKVVNWYDAYYPKYENTVTIPYGGIDYKISFNRLPDGYSKDEKGAAAYKDDIINKLNTTSGNPYEHRNHLEDFIKRSIISELDDDPNNITENDRNIISKYVNPALSEEQLLEILGKKKMEVDKYLRSSLATLGDVKYARVESLQLKLLIDKLSKSVVEQRKKQQALIMGADTESTLRANFIIDPLKRAEKAAEKMVERMRVEELGEEFFTGLEANRYKNNEEYESVMRRLNDGVITTTEVAKYVREGAQILDRKNRKALANGEITLNEYFERANKLQKNIENTLYKNPDILQREIAGVIAEYYAGDGSRWLGKWYVSDKEIDAVPQEVFKAAGIDITRPESQEAIRNIKKNEGILPFDNAIAKDSFLREFAKGIGSVPRGISATLSGIGASDDVKRVERLLDPVSNYTQQRTEYFDKNYGLFSDMMSGLGQFISQVVIMRGFAGLSAKAGQALGGVPAAAMKEGIKGNVIANSLINKADLYGIIASAYLQTYDSNLKDALALTNDPLAAKVMAFTNSAAEGLSETIFNNITFAKNFIKNLKGGIDYKRVAKIFERGVFDDVAQKQFGELMTEYFEKSIKATAKSFGGLVQESFEEVPVQLSNFITSALTNPEATKHRKLVPELEDAFVHGMVSFSIPSLLGLGGSLKQQFSDKTQQTALLIAAMNKGMVMEAIQNHYINGGITEEERDYKIKVLNTAAESLKQIPIIKNDGSRMNMEDMERYLANTVKEKFLREQARATDDEALRQSTEHRIKEITAEKIDILNARPAEPERPEPLSDEQIILEAIEAAKDIQDDGQRAAFLSNVSAGLREAAEQLHGTTGEAETANKFYGRRIADLALEKYPTPESLRDEDTKKSGVSVVPPSAGVPQQQIDRKGVSVIMPKGVGAVKSAVIEVNGKLYEGKNHAEAILKAKEAGEDISQIDRQRDGKFKIHDGTIVDRLEAKRRFGDDRAEMLIPQDEASKLANQEYSKLVGTIDDTAKEQAPAALRDVESTAKAENKIKDTDTWRDVYRKVDNDLLRMPIEEVLPFIEEARNFINNSKDAQAKEQYLDKLKVQEAAAKEELKLKEAATKSGRSYLEPNSWNAPNYDGNTDTYGHVTSSKALYDIIFGNGELDINFTQDGKLIYLNKGGEGQAARIRINGTFGLVNLIFDAKALKEAGIEIHKGIEAHTRENIPLKYLTEKSKKAVLDHVLNEMDRRGEKPTPEQMQKIAESLGFDNWNNMQEALKNVKSGLEQTPVSKTGETETPTASDDGSNPELVKAVEELLSKEKTKQEEVISKTKTTEPDTKQQIKDFGVSDEMVEPVHTLLGRMFEGLKKAGLTTAKSVGEWVRIGKGEEKPYTLKINGKEVQVKNVQPEVVNGFYSPLEKIIAESKFDKLPAKQWLEKFGKGEEAKWTGLADWLAQQQGTVSKADIQQYLKDNRIEIVEVVKGVKRQINENSKYAKDPILRKHFYEANSKYDFIVQLDNEIDLYNHIQKNYGDVDSDYIADDLWKSDDEPTKYHKYQLEGEKVNYKEILVTMPHMEGKIHNTKFKSSHFDEPNILVHLRMNTRVDAEGNKVLFLEEIQSDWGQKGKKEGFMTSELEDARKLTEEIRAKYNLKPYENIVGNDKVPYEEQLKLSGANLKKGNVMPSAPFVTDTNSWVKLGLKVALKEAVKQGADKIAWTTGEQQNDRYDLSKSVDEIVVEPAERDNYPPDWKSSDGKMYHVLGLKGGNTLFEDVVPESKIADIVGKEIAEKAINQKQTSFKGNDLKVGGKGMKGFYGSPTEGSLGIVGNVAKSLFKQEPKTIDIKIGEDNDSNEKSTQHSIDITPELKAQAEGGQPLFNKTVTSENRLSDKQHQKLLDTLNKAFNGKVKMLSQEEYDKRTGGKQTAFGAIFPDGSIYINHNKLDANTPIHEHTHLFNSIIKQHNPALWNAIVEATKQTQEYKNVQNDPDYANLETEDEIADEAFARIVANLGEGKWEQYGNKSVYQKLKELIKKYFNAVLQVLGVDVFKGMSADRLAELTLNELLGGRSISPAILQGRIIGLINQLLPERMRFQVNPNTRKILEKRLGEKDGRALYSILGNVKDPDKAVEFAKLKFPIKGTIASLSTKKIELENGQTVNFGDSVIFEEYNKFINEEVKEETKTEFKRPDDLLREVQYSFTQTKSQSEANRLFSGYYKEGELICTIKSDHSRHNNYFVTFIVRNDAKETPHAFDLTQDNLTPRWKEYLEKKGRKNEDGTYNLKGLKPAALDPYSTSVVSLQINKTNGTTKEISRYNHTLSSPDNIFNKDLDNVIRGLSDAMYHYFGVDKNTKQYKKKLPNNVIQDSEGRYFNYTKESNGVYYGDGFYVRNGVATILDSGSQRMVDGFVINANGTVENAATTFKEFPYGEIKKVNYIKGKEISVTTENGEFVFETDRGVVSKLIKYNEGFVFEMLNKFFGAEKDKNGDIILDSMLTGHRGVIHIYWNEKIAHIKGWADFRGSQITSLGSLQSIGGDAYFRDSQITSLGSLQSIGGDAYFRDSQITSLGSLQSIGGDADFRDSQITSLGSLQSIGGNAYFSGSQITSLGSLQSIGGDADFRGSQITSLGSLQSIGGNAYFSGSQITSLGSLQSIDGDAYFSGSQITSLGSLQSIGGDADFRGSQITSLGSLQSIDGDAYFIGSQITSLGSLQSIGGDAYFRGSQITSLGSLQSIGGDAYFIGSQITSLGSLQSIGGDADFRDSQITSLGSLQSIGGNAYFRDSQITSLGSLQSIGGDAYVRDIQPNAEIIRTIKTNDPLARTMAKKIHKKVLKDIKNKNENSLKKDAEAQYRIESGKNIVEALQDFDGSPEAVTALTHEIMHPTVVEIFNGARQGNEVGLRHANTIVGEYNKAHPDSPVTVEQMIADNEAFKNGTTTKEYRAVQEFIAEAWERYHQEGAKGFSKAFQEVLELITEAFRQVYKTLTGNNLTPELRDFFDELLGVQEEAKVAESDFVSTDVDLTEVDEKAAEDVIDKVKKVEMTERSEITAAAQSTIPDVFDKISKEKGVTTENLFDDTIPSDATLYEIITGEDYTYEQRGIAAAYLVANRILYSNADEFVTKLFGKASNPENKIRIINDPNSGFPSLMANSKGVIIINAAKLGNQLKQFGGEKRYFNWLESAINEEVLHLATFKVTNEAELNQVADEMTPEQRRAVKDFYAGKLAGKEMSKPVLAAEYIRILLQERMNGVTTEMFRPTSARSAVRNILSKLLTYIRNIFSAKKNSKANEIVRRIEDYIAGRNKEIKPKISLHERPDVGNPVYKVEYGGGVYYIQQATNIDNVPAWYLVEKKDNVWSAVQDESPEPGFLGWNQAEALNEIRNRTDISAAASEEGITKPKISIQERGAYPVYKVEYEGRKYFIQQSVNGGWYRVNMINNKWQPIAEDVASADPGFIGWNMNEAIKSIKEISEDKDRAIEEIIEPKQPAAEGGDLLKDYVIPAEENIQAAFGTDITKQKIWNEMPSDDKRKVYVNMLDIGKDMIAKAQVMWGYSIYEYGPQLMQYIRGMEKGFKKAILMATFIAELKETLMRSPDDVIRVMYRDMSLYYRNFMHEAALTLVPGRLLRLYTEKFMADIFQDIILEKDQINGANAIRDAESKEIENEDVINYDEQRIKGKTSVRVKNENKRIKKEREDAKRHESKRKSGSKQEYIKKATAKESEINKKYGSEEIFFKRLMEKAKELNNKCK